MKKIIAAIDFSKTTDAVLVQAALYAKTLGAKLWIIHVASDETQAMAYESTQLAGYAPDFITMPGDVQLARDINADELRHEHAQLLAIASRLRNGEIDAQAILLKGDAAKHVLEKAEDLDAELIIVGSHGHGLLHKALLGSVSEALIRHATCNILIVPSLGKSTI